MPENGYTKLFENLLDNPSINLKLNTEFDKSMEKITIIYLIQCQLMNIMNLNMGNCPIDQ